MSNDQRAVDGSGASPRREHLIAQLSACNPWARFDRFTDPELERMYLTASRTSFRVVRG